MRAPSLLQAARSAVELKLEDRTGDVHNSALCVAAYVFCEARLTSAYAATGLSMYDMTKKGDYVENKWIEEWLNKCASCLDSAPRCRNTDVGF